jgi:hypothetical protein
MRTPACNKTIHVVALLWFTFIILPSILFAQRDSKVSAEVADKLKGKSCLLVLPASEYKFMKDYEELVPSAWTLTPIQVIKYDNLPGYAAQGDQFAFFMIDGDELTTRMYSDHPASAYRNTHYYLTLAQGREGKKKMEGLCRIELYPDFTTTDYSFYHKDHNEQVYLRSSFRNFQLPFILAYLKFVQKNLEQQKSPSINKEYHNDSLMKRLATDTLYVLDNAIFERNKFTGKENALPQSEFMSYKGKYKYIKTEELIRMIKTRNNDKPLFLFEYVLSSTDKYVGVLDIMSGSVVYREHVSMSYNLHPKDLEKIVD